MDGAVELVEEHRSSADFTEKERLEVEEEAEDGTRGSSAGFTKKERWEVDEEADDEADDGTRGSSATETGMTVTPSFVSTFLVLRGTTPASGLIAQGEGCLLV